VRVSAWVPTSTFDAIARTALQRGVSMSALVRQTIARIVTPHPPHKAR
jgi:hypothetical protein